MAAAAGAVLSNSVLNLGALREYGRKELTDLLDAIPGKKALVMDSRFAGPLGLIAERALLKDHGVEKSFYLTPGRLDTDIKSIVYLVRPRAILMNYIADHIRVHANEGQRKEYTVIFVPRRTMICEKILEEKGVYGDVRIGEYHLDLIPFDDDVLSLELESSFREVSLDGDKSSLFYVAKSLSNLQSVFGVIPTIRGVGSSARSIKEMLMRMRKEASSDPLSTSTQQVASEIDMLILIDRELDMITPMCTQLTYEGLIDEIMGINNTYLDVDPEVVGQPKGGKKVKIVLNSNDKLYSEIRDLNFTVIGPMLNKKAKFIDEYYKKRHDAQTVAQIRDFMKGLGAFQQEHQSLRIHTNIAEILLQVTKGHEFHKRLEAEQTMLVGADTSAASDYIEECINRKDNLLKILRLLCLLSLTGDGLKAKQHEFFKREIAQTYGFEYVVVLNQLEKMGVFRREGGKGATYSSLRKQFNLICEANEAAPSDISYVYSGYAPLSIRMVQTALKGPASWKDINQKVPQYAFFEEHQSPHPGQRERSAAAAANRNSVVLIFFVGGVCFTEISALRFLQQLTPGYEMIIGTTKLLNGDVMLTDSAVDAVEQMKNARR